MSDLAAFHFIRPLVLLLVPAVLLIWWLVRARATRPAALPAGIAPHLATALQVGAGKRSRLLPIDWVSALIILLTLAAAGPTWSRIPNPLLAQTAPLAVLLEASDAMNGVDVAPSRIERAKHKIHDLLDTRSGARTALIAYAGSAHRVTPMTNDPEVIRPFVEGLSPAVMPRPGDNATAALSLAEETLAKEPVPGAILFVAGAINTGDLGAFRSHAQNGGAPIVVLLVSKDQEGSSEIASIPNTTVVAVTPDGDDIAQVDRIVARAFEEALANDDRQQWEDRGWMLAWPAALLTLLWFRRGWTMRWGFALWLSALAADPGSARAEGLTDWFFTPDQQGQRAFDDKEFSRAADLFEDPAWHGYALYRAGRYEEAAEYLARLDTAEAAFIQGLAHIRFRQYRDGVRAFETALQRRPDYPEAARNLEIAKAIVTFVEETQEQSSTEEGSEGADEVRYDKETGKGTETVLDETKGFDPATADQWMRSVETRTSDFLRSRFALEAARRRE
ncbi:VWA domain-containing protein [Rhodobacteraceae bacterium NNCM2]|nr:VWA domain-containing protein [Coraliihabitans acroporae]